MKLSLNCPTCDRAIADLHHKASHQQVKCLSCKREYGVVYGKLSQRTTMQEVLLFLKSTLPSFYKRHYSFQITTADRTLKQLQFSVPGKADSVPVNSGDIMSVLYTMQGYVMQKLVAIANHTTGKQYILPTPVPSTSRHLALFLIAMGCLLTLSFLGGWNWFVTAGLSAIGLLSYFKFSNTANLTSPPLEGQARLGKRLLQDQRLLAQQRKLEQRVGELQHEHKATQMLIHQLETLKQKMSQIDPALYAARIHRANHAMNLLKQQLVNNQRLVREYERTLRMIDIEVETTWIADQLPDSDHFSRSILTRLAELKQIEDQNQDLKDQLAAYEEVQLHGIHHY